MHNGVGNLIDGILLNRGAAFSTYRYADARKQKTQIVIDLSGRCDSRTRSTRGISLANSNGGSNSVNFVDFGFLDAFQELPGVCRQRFDVPALAFGIDCVERKGGFSRAAYPGDDRQGIMRYFEVNIFEVVNPHSTDNNAVRPCEVCRCGHKPAIIPTVAAVYGRRDIEIADCRRL